MTRIKLFLLAVLIILCEAISPGSVMGAIQPNIVFINGVMLFVEQPDGWFGPKVNMDWPGIYNLRLDPFEKTMDNRQGR